MSCLKVNCIQLTFSWERNLFFEPCESAPSKSEFAEIVWVFFCVCVCRWLLTHTCKQIKSSVYHKRPESILQSFEKPQILTGKAGKSLLNCKSWCSCRLFFLFVIIYIYIVIYIYNIIYIYFYFILLKKSVKLGCNYIFNDWHWVISLPVWKFIASQKDDRTTTSSSNNTNVYPFIGCCGNVTYRQVA